jgi:aspartyl-tRNA(Asn)/glutamyl-tRNA(Gln) amidotransferase subunit A
MSFPDIASAAAQLRARKISCVELTRDALAALEREQPRINAFITVTGEQALAEAAARDAELARGQDRGPLHGIPIAHKDLVYTKGVRTTGGSKIYADFVPDTDAVVAVRLREAGAVMVGKTGLHEIAYGITSANPHFGPVRNPHDPERVPGGSSGGSAAAVVTGMCFMALGTDTGGSIRIPASFCGCAGIKPTFGLVPREGVMPLGFSLDHIGPLTRTVRDAALTLEVMAAATGLQPSAQPSLEGVRIGWPENFFFDLVQPEVKKAIERAASEATHLGATIVPVRMPDLDAYNTTARVILLAEAVAAYAPYLDRRDLFGPDVFALLQQGRLIPAHDYVNAQRLRRRYQKEFGKLWSQVDCLFAPGTPTTAPKIGQTTMQITPHAPAEDVRLATTRVVRAVNLLGYPTVSVPCGRHAGLPIGLQIIGPPRGERALIATAAALEPHIMN